MRGSTLRDGRQEAPRCGDTSITRPGDCGLNWIDSAGHCVGLKGSAVSGRGAIVQILSAKKGAGLEAGVEICVLH